MYNIAVIGDSFIKHLSDNAGLCSYSFHFKLNDGRSIQSINRLLDNTLHLPPRTNLIIIHLGGNDLSSTDVNPELLAQQYMDAVVGVLQANDIHRAAIFPALHRERHGLAHPLSCYARHPFKQTIKDPAKHFNDRVDVFNKHLRYLIQHHTYVFKIRLGRLAGLNGLGLLIDGVHLLPELTQKYASCLLREAKCGFHP